ncbi:hypothetical protein Tco_1043395 [Tanacetum coccineum]|uniref:Uncharacterized protein n=1 Tax=Tanacetum coccineum TaxID=301880 RepID=A0ABQ5GLX0_9ASTR
MITLTTTMAVLDSCPKHNMVAYLEKTEGNAEPSDPSELPAEPQLDTSPAYTSEVHMEQQTDPSPRPSPSTIIPDSIPDSSGRNLGGHSSSDKSLLGIEGEMTLQSVYDLCLSLCAQHGSQWEKLSKGELSFHKDPLFDDIPEIHCDQRKLRMPSVGRTRDNGVKRRIDENIQSTEGKLKVLMGKEKVLKIILKKECYQATHHTEEGILRRSLNSIQLMKKVELGKYRRVEKSEEERNKYAERKSYQ